MCRINNRRANNPNVHSEVFFAHLYFFSVDAIGFHRAVDVRCTADVSVADQRRVFASSVTGRVHRPDAQLHDLAAHQLRLHAAPLP